MKNMVGADINTPNTPGDKLARQPWPVRAYIEVFVKKVMFVGVWAAVTFVKSACVVIGVCCLAPGCSITGAPYTDISAPFGPQMRMSWK